MHQLTKTKKSGFLQKNLFITTALGLVMGLGLALTPASVLAGDPSGCDPGDGGVDLGTCLKLSDDQPIKEVYTNPAFLVNLLVRNVMILGGIMVLVLAIIVGYKYLFGGKKGMEEANQIALWGLVGFLIMFSAYWIVQLVKLITGADILI